MRTTGLETPRRAAFGVCVLAAAADRVGGQAAMAGTPAAGMAGSGFGDTMGTTGRINTPGSGR